MGICVHRWQAALDGAGWLTSHGVTVWVMALFMLNDNEEIRLSVKWFDYVAII